jgi:hypothetical protein
MGGYVNPTKASWWASVNPTTTASPSTATTEAAPPPADASSAAAAEEDRRRASGSDGYEEIAPGIYMDTATGEIISSQFSLPGSENFGPAPVYMGEGQYSHEEDYGITQARQAAEYLNYWNATSGNLDQRLEQFAQQGPGYGGIPLLAAVLGLPQDQVMASGPMQRFQDHMRSRSSWSPFGNSWLTDILDADPLGTAESFFGGGIQPIDYLANPFLSILDGDDKEHALSLGRMGGRAMAGYGLGVAAGPSGGAMMQGMLNTAAGGDPRIMIAQQALGMGSNAAAPYVNDAIDAGSDYWRRLGQGGMPEGGAMVDGVMVDGATSGGLAAPAVTDLSQFLSQPTLSGPASVISPDGVARSAQPGMFGEWQAPAPSQSFGGDPLNALSAPLGGAAGLGSAFSSTAEGGAMVDGEMQDGATEGGTSTGSNLTGADLQRYLKIGQTVNSLLSSDSPEGAPQRDEGETDADYTQELVDYANLDAAAMAEAGLQPGSPEYYEYIMAQMDSVIAQTLGDLDVDAEDFADQLRAKTQEELLALQRALYVRGQVELLMGSGTYTDPATGIEEEVIGEGMFDPNVGAYQRGLARSTDTLAGLRGEDAMNYLNELLGRDTDFFGMQQQADERYELAKRNEQDELRRRRGMFSE